MKIHLPKSAFMWIIFIQKKVSIRKKRLPKIVRHLTDERTQLIIKCLVPCLGEFFLIPTHNVGNGGIQGMGKLDHLALRNIIDITFDLGDGANAFITDLCRQLTLGHI